MVADGAIITVMGATGRQGGAVARRLLASGWRVRAVTRNPSSAAAQALAALGATVVMADMADRATLVTAFRDAYGVYSVQNPMISGLDAEVAQGRNVGDAAYDAGVRHIVYGSTATGVAGSGVGSWETKVAVAAHLESLGLLLTVLRPTAFMELMSDKSFYPAVSTWHLMPKLMGEDRQVGWLAVEDLGAIAAMAFGDTERFAGLNLGLAADVRSIGECRRIWGDITGRPPRRFPMPERIFQRFVGDDLPTMWRWLRDNEVDWGTTTTRELLPDAMSVRDWVSRKHQPVAGPDRIQHDG